MAELLLFPELARVQPAGADIPDAAERARALDIERSFIVEAPAGSGKTGLLIQRFMKLLASASVEQPAQVLAITFTRKATAEMRDRVFRQLTEAAGGSPPANAFDEAIRPLAEAVLARSAQLGWNLLDDPRRLNIRTIDAVCADLARDLPILSGSGGAQQPSEDAASLHAEAARRTLMLLGGEDRALNEALSSLLLHRDGNLAACEGLIAAMLGARDQWGELVPLSRPELDDQFLDTMVLPRLERALDLAICRALARLAGIMPTPLLDRLTQLAADMAHLDGYDGGPSPLAFCADLPPEQESAHLEHWRALIDLLLTQEGTFRANAGLQPRFLKVRFEPAHKTELVNLLETVRGDETLREALCEVRCLPPAQYPPDQWRVAKALFRVLSRALVELQMVFASRGRCDFIEPALQAKAALRREGALDDLHLSPAFDLQHLLVDEMQDTSSAQYELIQLLTQSWDGSSQTVFLVGDPKQSIYLFRQARVERFVQTMHQLKLGVDGSGTLDALPLTALHLTANFRSQGRLVKAFNETFTAIFPDAPDPTRAELVPYRPASAIRPSAAATLQWHAAVLPNEPDPERCKTRERSQRRADAAEMRRIAAEALARNSQTRIAVLVRNRIHLLEIVAAFKAAPGVPYRAVEIEPLGERQEILDLQALTRALLHPADRTAWLALLRTPWCGLRLADLHLLAGADDHRFANRNVLDLMIERGDLLSEDGIARLRPFFSIMSQALAERGRLPLSRLLERTTRAFGAAHFDSLEAASNIERYLRLLDQLETDAPVDLPTLSSRLKGLYAAPAIHPGAVDLLTIHKAKGLEWDLVLVPALERAGRANTGRLLSWLELDPNSQFSNPDAARGIVAPIKSKGGAGRQLNEWMRSIENAREAAERARLFYVACTRAREELHLFASISERSKGEIVPPAGSLLAAAWPAAEPHFHATSMQPLMPLSFRLQREESDRTFDLAAAAALPEVPPPMTQCPTQRLIQRIPTEWMTLPEASALETPAAAFARPLGSFSARAFGNTMHSFLELLAGRIARGESDSALLTELPSWTPRIAAVLRATGLPGPVVERFTANTLRGLTQTLRSPDGLWLLAAHPAAATEATLTALAGDTLSSLRLDRTFLAGADPGSTGKTHLWIVDYKTASHGKQDLDNFLRKEEDKYRPQLETYAARLEQTGKLVRLALFYPMIPTLRLLQ